jgi:DNA-binding MarR family transcriptional regulator
MSMRVPSKHRELFSLLSDLSRAVRCCQQEALFCENVTFTQFFILDMVSSNGTLRQGELHEILSVEKSTTTRFVQPLVKQGLLIREKSNRDSRAINLRLTKKGEAVLGNVWVCLSRFVEGIRRGIPEERRSEVFESVKTFLSAMRNACNAGLYSIQELNGRRVNE